MTATQPNGSSALFTVEQVELIRRLRNSGVSKEQLVVAWETLERVDQELGPVYTVPVTIAAAFQQQAQALQRASLTAAFSALTTPNATINTTSGNAAVVANAVANAATASAAIQLQQQQQLQAASLASLPPDKPPPALPQSPLNDHTSDNSRKRSADGSFIGEGDVASPVTNHTLTPGDIASLINGLTESGEDAEESQEYKDFVKQGHRECAREIKDFVLHNNIKQTQIATLAGISQSYVSRYLKGDYLDMSDRSRRSLQRWYILYRKCPEGIVPAVNAYTLMNPSPDKKSTVLPEVPTSSPVNGDQKYPRRERFVFRPNHLDILEKCFQDDNYPSYNKRMEIAQACNDASTAITHRELTDKEKVSVQIISNWFANKRKELKKLAREEGLDMTQVAMRPRGRPSRLYSDIAMMQSMEKGTIRTTEPLTVTPDPNSTDGVTPAENIPQVPEIAAEVNGMNGTENSALTEDEVLLNGGESQLGMDNDESLSWSVEMAAVNQAILSLTGQQPINPLQTIKTEATQSYKTEATINS